MRFIRLALLLCLLLPFASAAHASETPAEHAASIYAQQEMSAAPLHENLPDYSLPPDKLAKAQHLAKVRVALRFTAEAWGMVQLVLLLGLGAVAWMRDTALRASHNRWVQGYLFLLMLLLARVLLNLPLNVYGHSLAVKYGFSIQGWGSWFGDLGKSLALYWLIGGALVMLLFFLIRKAPQRWWLVFWVASIPIVLAGVFLAPLTIDPLFNQFEPLQEHHPDLVAKLEQMKIPADHMFLMKASAKVTTPNAYVTGFGASKRLVIWDTSLTKGTSDEVLWMFGHEAGHYVLGHVLHGVLLTLAILPLLLYLGYRLLHIVLARFGAGWRIASQEDWGALAVVLLVFAVFSVISEPVENTISRHIEHAADIYGQEAIHSLVLDPQAAVKQACDTDGESTLDDPNPSRFIEFWTYNHPAESRRAAFGRAYNPWAPGVEPKYFKKER